MKGVCIHIPSQQENAYREGEDLKGDIAEDVCYVGVLGKVVKLDEFPNKNGAPSYEGEQTNGSK